MGGAFVFFFMAFFVFLPMLVFAPAKFALSFTFGSLCTMAAMNMLSGWKAGMEHMFSAERRLFTTVYLGSMFATLYAALYMRSYLLSLGFSIVQVKKPPAHASRAVLINLANQCFIDASLSFVQLIIPVPTMLPRALCTEMLLIADRHAMVLGCFYITDSLSVDRLLLHGQPTEMLICRMLSAYGVC